MNIKVTENRRSIRVERRKSDNRAVTLNKHGRVNVPAISIYAWMYSPGAPQEDISLSGK